MTIEEYKAQIKKRHEHYIDQVRVIAENAQTEIIDPFCRKHNVKFESAMGEYGFFTDKGEDMCRTHAWEVTFRNAPTEVTAAAPEDYATVLAALTMEVPDNMGFGLYLFMSSYSPPGFNDG